MGTFDGLFTGGSGGGFDNSDSDNTDRFKSLFTKPISSLTPNTTTIGSRPSGVGSIFGGSTQVNRPPVTPTVTIGNIGMPKTTPPPAPTQPSLSMSAAPSQNGGMGNLLQGGLSGRSGLNAVGPGASRPQASPLQSSALSPFSQQLNRPSMVNQPVNLAPGSASESQLPKTPQPFNAGNAAAGFGAAIARPFVGLPLGAAYDLAKLTSPLTGKVPNQLSGSLGGLQNFATNNNPGNLGSPAQLGGDAAQVALSAVPGGKAIAELPLLARLGMSAGGQLARRVIGEGTLGAAYNVAGDVSTGQATPQSVGTNALTGFAGFGALGGVSRLAGMGARGVGRGIEDTISARTGTQPLSRLTSYEGAPDRAAVDAYKQKIQSGQPIEPLKVAKDSQGNLGIEDGKHRFQAAQELGMKRVPVANTEPKLSEVSAQAGTRPPSQKVIEDALNRGDYAAARKANDALVASDPYKVSNAKLIEESAGNKSAALAAEPDKSTVINAAIENKPGARPVDGSVTPRPGDRGFTTSVRQALQFSPELRGAVDSSYTKASDAAAVAKSDAFMDQPIEKAHSDVLARLQSTDAPNKQLIVDAGRVLQALDATGQTAEAHNIHSLMAEKLTQAGQTSQAAALVLRRSPEGLYYSAVKDIQKASGKITPEQDLILQGMKEGIQSTAPGSAERDTAVAEMNKYVSKQAPSSLADKAFGIWRAGLLTGPRTVAKIITSHSVQGPLEQIKNVPAAAVDKIASFFTGQRSQVLGGKGFMAGFGQGAKEAGQYMKTGMEKNPISGKLELHNTINYGNSVPGKITQAYVDGVGRVHGSLYKPFYGAAHLESLYNQGKASAINAGLKGDAADAFVKDFVANPSKDALNVATNDAQNATFQQETQLGKVASAIQSKGGILGKVIAPFTRIPSAIATDVFNYSPVGAVKTIVQGIKAARSDTGWTLADQRAFSQGLGRSIVGSAAVLPGAMLYSKGMMTLDYPTSDTKQQQLWAEQGKRPNSILIDGAWRDLGSLGPLGSVLAMGGHLSESLQKGSHMGQAAIDAFAGALKSVESQSYIQGVAGAVNATQDPGRYLGSLQKQYAGSVIPTGLATLASGLDPNARQMNTSMDAVKARIPGLRETLPVKTDSLGKPIPNPSGGIGAMFDPFYSQKSQPGTPVTSELQRLDGANAGVSQPKITTKENFNSIKTTLTKDQAIQLQQNIGDKLDTMWSQAIANDRYQQLSDADKQKVLEDISKAVTASQKEQYAKANQLGQYNPNYVGKKTTTPTRDPNVDSLIPKVQAADRRKPFIRQAIPQGQLQSTISSPTGTATPTPSNSMAQFFSNPANNDHPYLPISYRWGQDAGGVRGMIGPDGIARQPPISPPPSLPDQNIGNRGNASNVGRFVTQPTYIDAAKQRDLLRRVKLT